MALRCNNIEYASVVAQIVFYVFGMFVMKRMLKKACEVSTKS